MTPSTEVFFIVDGARLEAQACLLAPTLKAHLTDDQRAVADIREDYLDQLEDFTRATLAACKVELRTIPGTAEGAFAPWAAPYPHGNKILAAATPRDCAVSVFLDTDVVLSEPVDFAAELGDALIGACVSDYASATGSDEDWAAFYDAFDLPLPTDRVQYNAGRKLISYPYFNAGMIVFREQTHDGTPTHIGRDWLEVAVKFEREVRRDYARVNIDQFTLPILGYLRGAPVKALPQHLNFNIESFGSAPGQRQSIAHYHRLGILWAHRRHGRATLELLSERMGEDAPETFLETFGTIAKRKRMKHHLRAMAEKAAALAATAPAGPHPDPQKQRHHQTAGNRDKDKAA